MEKCWAVVVEIKEALLRPNPINGESRKILMSSNHSKAVKNRLRKYFNKLRARIEVKRITIDTSDNKQQLFDIQRL